MSHQIDAHETAVKAIREIANVIEAAVAEAGPMGLPNGPIYATMMDIISLDVYNAIVRELVKAGRIDKQGDSLVAPEA
jgi:hypothetical protein